MTISLEAHAPADSLTATALRQVATRLAGWPDLASRVRADRYERTWVRLDAGAHTVAWLIRWPAGTGTGWHDHLGRSGPVSGAFAVVGGTLQESVWADDRPARRELGAGRVVSFGPGYVHDVEGVSVEPALSVHVYSPELVSMRTFEPRGRALALIGVGPLDEW